MDKRALSASLSDFQVIVVPGLHNSGPGHWQTRWEALFPQLMRVQQDDWEHPSLDAWVRRLDELRARDPRPTLFLAHSFGCLTTGVFTRMSIEENLLMGAFTRNDKAGIAADVEQWYGVFPRLKERRSQLAGTLSGGEQQMLAMARALMSHPELLLLDEPSMGLSPIMVEKIFEVIRNVSKQGVTILLVEQNAKLALEAAHRGYVMESGAILMSGNGRDMLHDPRVKAAYLGE